MPMYDFVCPICAWHTEEIFAIVECPASVPCNKCGWVAEKSICHSPTGILTEDAAWLKTVTRVVDGDGGDHCKQFIKDPTRKNYQEWMRKEGLRPLEPGEERGRKRNVDLSGLKKKVMDAHAARKRIEI